MPDTKTFVTSEELQKSSRQYQKDLLVFPVIAAKNDTLKHMAGRGGVYGDLVMGGLDLDLELAPYSRKNWEEGKANIPSRTLTTYLGNCAYDFDPNDLYETIYWDAKTEGKNLSHADIIKAVVFVMAAKLGEKLNEVIWSAKRNPDGKKTKDLFNGLDTITAAEVLAGTISTENKNLINLSKFDNANAVDQCNAIYRASSPQLRAMKTKMYMSQDIYDLYVECYQNTRGALPYNQSYEKGTLEVGNGLVELCPMVSKAGSSFVHLAPKKNMFYGFHGSHEKECFAIGDYKPWETTVKAAMIFGTQIRSIDKRFLMVGKIAGQ